MTTVAMRTAMISALTEAFKQRLTQHQHHHCHHQAARLRHHLHSSPCKIWYISSAGVQALQVGLGLCIRTCMRECASQLVESSCSTGLCL